MLRTISIALIFATLAWMPAAHAIADERTPSELYIAYHSKLKKSFGHEAVWKFYSSEAREEFETKYPPQLRNKAFYFMKTSEPSAIKVVDEKINGDTAILKLAADGGHRNAKGEAELTLEEGIWKLNRVVWTAE